MNVFGSFSGFIFAAACSLTNILSSPYTFWFPIVVLAAIAVILVAIVIGMLAPLLGRNNLVPWARMKAYEEIATVIIAIIFLGFSSIICAFNPVPVLGSIGLVPQSCSGSGSVAIDNIWGLATCNMYTFNQNFVHILTVGYWLSMLDNFGPKIGIAATLGGIGADASGSFTTGTSSLFISPLLQILIAEMTVSMLQVILLSSSAILFSFLIGIGLIARAFGTTRTFGNAMIALGIGIGLIYPLLVIVSYGFINTTFSNIVSAELFAFANLVGNTAATTAITFANLLSLMPTLFASTTALSFGTGIVAQIWNIIGLFVLLGSVVMFGLIFIPALNFMILEAFVRDFSSALGQQVSFMEMLNQVL